MLMAYAIDVVGFAVRNEGQANPMAPFYRIASPNFLVSVVPCWVSASLTMTAPLSLALSGAVSLQRNQSLPASLVDFVLPVNLPWRHLSPGQQAALGASSLPSTKRNPAEAGRRCSSEEGNSVPHSILRPTRRNRNMTFGQVKRRGHCRWWCRWRCRCRCPGLHPAPRPRQLDQIPTHLRRWIVDPMTFVLCCLYG